MNIDKDESSQNEDLNIEKKDSTINNIERIDSFKSNSLLWSSFFESNNESKKEKTSNILNKSW